MLKIEITSKFNQLLDDLRFRNPELETEINERISWFQKNSQDTRLDNHKLTRRMTGQWAFPLQMMLE